MSLLSELIARLTALIEQNRQGDNHLQGAQDQAETVLAQVRAATEGSSSSLAAEGLAQWQAGLEKLGEARASFAAGDEKMAGYIALLLGSGGGASGRAAGSGGRPQGSTPTHVSRADDGPGAVKGPAKNGINPPNVRRHLLGKIRKGSRTEELNTVILPSVDVNADMQAIREGRAKWRPEINRYEVNGRLWGVEPHGTVFPDSGPGLVRLDRFEYRALKGLVQARGDMDNRPMDLVLNPAITEAHWRRAAEVYRYHPHNDQGGP